MSLYHDESLRSYRAARASQPASSDVRSMTCGRRRGPVAECHPRKRQPALVCVLPERTRTAFCHFTLLTPARAPPRLHPHRRASSRRPVLLCDMVPAALATACPCGRGRLKGGRHFAPLLTRFGVPPSVGTRDALGGSSSRCGARRWSPRVPPKPRARRFPKVAFI